MPTYRAVVFDFDGTLARTMEDHFRAWQAVMADCGVTLQPEDYYPLEGLRVEELPKHFCERHGLPPPSHVPLLEKKEQYYLSHHSFALYQGVEEQLARLRAGRVPIGLVTAGLRARLQGSVPSGFLEQFDAVVTGDETSEGKPSPVPYLLGAEKLGLEPGMCVVVENAPLGIESAKRAGAYCVALSTTMPRHYLAAADRVLGSFDELNRSGVLERLLNGACVEGG